MGSRQASRNLRIEMILLSILMLASCAQFVSETPSGVDKKLGAFSFIKENKNLVVVVDVELAIHRIKEHYFPLGIKIANKRLSGLSLDRDSFILIDQDGTLYKMPEVEEIEMYYDKLIADHKFKSQTGLVGDRMLTSFSLFRKAESNFFPQAQGAGRIIEAVYIQNKGFMEDLIYFPMPPEGIGGKVLCLRIDAVELEAPFEICFIVGQKKNKNKRL